MQCNFGCTFWPDGGRESCRPGPVTVARLTLAQCDTHHGQHRTQQLQAAGVAVVEGAVHQRRHHGEQQHKGRGVLGPDPAQGLKPERKRQGCQQQAHTQQRQYLLPLQSMGPLPRDDTQTQQQRARKQQFLRGGADSFLQGAGVGGSNHASAAQAQAADQGRTHTEHVHLLCLKHHHQGEAGGAEQRAGGQPGARLDAGDTP